MKLLDLIDIFSEKYEKPVVITCLRPGEKMVESLISETQSMRLINGPDGYKYIKPPYKNINIHLTNANHNIKNYNSQNNHLNKKQLLSYLTTLNLI